MYPPLPEAETRLQQHLADRYTNIDWRPALKAVMDAEGDVVAALEAVGCGTRNCCISTNLEIQIPAHPKMPLQVTSLETELMHSVDDLKS